MKFRKRKQPAARISPSGREVRVERKPDDFDDFEISWHFRDLDMEGPFGWHACDKRELIEKIHTRLTSFESMRWREVLGKKELHAIPVYRLDKSAQRRLEEIRQADIEQLFTMRVETKPRIWGIKDRIYFRVLWWDPDHQVYPMNITNN